MRIKAALLISLSGLAACNPDTAPTPMAGVGSPHTAVAPTTPGAYTAPVFSSTPYDMRGIKLGITLEEFKATDLPQEPDRKNARVSCRGNSKNAEQLICSLASDRTNVGSPLSHELTLGYARSTDLQFWFTRAADGDLRLTEILFRAEMNKLGDVYPSLLEKYGAPLITAGKAQNAFGTAFEQEEARWVNGISSITVETRCEKTYLFCVRYTDIGLMGIFLNKAREKQIPAAKRI